MPVLPALSLAVTVMVLSPLERVMLETDQLVVPEAVPLDPVVLFFQLMLEISLSSEAVPLRLTVLELVA